MFDGKFALEAMGQIITKGLPVSALIVAATVLISMPLAFLLGLLRFKRVKGITQVSTVLISFFRGVPLVILIFILYSAMPDVLTKLGKLYGWGIDFYNIPTTVLSQVDSSVGGKTAVDLGSLKNIIGAFWQPKAVIIDPDVLSTLDDRQIAAGLAEALKMGLILDPGLVDLFEQDPLPVDEIIARSVDLKRMIVEEDEKEQGRRALLNFGHTVGHAMEGAWGLDAWLHGECVAAGMDFMLEDDTLRARVAGLKQKLGLPEIPVPETDVLMDYIRHDKKTGDAHITIVTVAEAGNGQLSRVPFDEVRRRIEARKQAAAGEHTEAAHE